MHTNGIHTNAADRPLEKRPGLCQVVVQRALTVHIDKSGMRASLLADVPGLGKVYWHRAVAYSWDPQGRTWAELAALEADHVSQRWWYVRKADVEFVSGLVNRARQGAAGLAGAIGERDRDAPPEWAAPPEEFGSSSESSS